MAAHKAAELLRRTGCLSRILLLGTCYESKVGPVIDAPDAEVMLDLVVGAVVIVAVWIQWVAFVVIEVAFHSQE